MTARNGRPALVDLTQVAGKRATVSRRHARVISARDTARCLGAPLDYLRAQVRQRLQSCSGDCRWLGLADQAGQVGEIANFTPGTQPDGFRGVLARADRGEQGVIGGV